MKNKEILEGNKLIEVFIDNEVSGDTVIHKIGQRTHISESNYHKDWNMLMSVVEKIEKLGFDSRIHGNNSDDGYLCDFIQDNTNNEISCFVTWQDNGGTKIEATYKAVVEFIKWYNENKTTNNGK